jgi:Flp pilus assembly protein TadB
MITTVNGLDAQLPLLIRHLENALRAGYNLNQAFGIIAKDMDGAAAADAQIVLDAVAGGVAFPAALAQWVARVPSRDLDLIVAAFLVQFEAGGNLADKLSLLGQIMAKRTLPA